MESGRPVIHSFAHGGGTYCLPPRMESFIDESSGEAVRRPVIDQSWLDEMNKDFAVIDDSGTVVRKELVFPLPVPLFFVRFNFSVICLCPGASRRR